MDGARHDPRRSGPAGAGAGQGADHPPAPAHRLNGRRGTFRYNPLSLTDDILQRWREHSDVTPRLVGDIRNAFRYRDWLAHGRYWVAKLGRQYDFETVYDLGRDVEMAFPFLRS